MEREDRRETRKQPTVKRAGSRALLVIVAGSVIAASLGGCVYSREKERVVPGSTPVVIAPAPTERVVTYAEGRWQLYGDGSSRAPFYWAWIPAGSNPSSPPPVPPLPRTSQSIR